MNTNSIVSKIKGAKYRLRRDCYIRAEEKGNSNGASNRNVFTHITYCAVGNAGDTVLSQCVRRTYETSFNTAWSIRSVKDPVDDGVVNNMNATKAIIVGGGGLFLPDTNANSVSGWQWAISKDCLRNINTPLIGYSIGYNYFPGQTNSDLFIENLNAFCRKADFIGLRNHGSVKAVKSLLTDELTDKVCYQPCTTTLIRKLYALPAKTKSNRVAINMAFDREQIRFGEDQELILNQVAKFAKTLEEKGYQIVLVYHMQNDKKIIPYMEAIGIHYEQKDLTAAFPKDVYDFYNGIELVAGMRGHAQMIPFGLNCKIISLGTHDKMRWFLEDIDATDWYVDLRTDPATICERMLECFSQIELKSTDVRLRLLDKQTKLWQITYDNMNKIKTIIGGVKRRISGRIRAHKNRRVNYAIQNRIGTEITISIDDILLHHVHNDRLMRLDIVVRYLAIENYYGKNDNGFDLYYKMQEKRVGKGYGEKAVPRFHELIASYESNGYDKTSAIVLDRNLGLIDGSHRIALGLYYGVKNISALEIDYDVPVDYSIDWFIQEGFSEQEIEQIVNKANELLMKHNSLFACIVWSPATTKTEDIVKDLSYYGEVNSVQYYPYKSKEEYANIVRAIYAIDDIESWKIEKKLDHMNAYNPELTSIQLTLKNADYRIKESTGKPLSREVERAKKAIRSRYKDQIDNYFHDIILHIADNRLQSDYMRKVLQPDIDLEEIFDLLEPYHYALLKDTAPYMSEDFPKEIPVGKDIDILCNEDEAQDIKNILREYVLDERFNDYDIRYVDKTSGWQLRFEIDSRLIFLIDLIWSVSPELSVEYVNDALASRMKKKCYFIVSPQYEFLYRGAAYLMNPNKTHHLNYLMSHKKDIDATAIERYVDVQYKDKLLDILK